LKLCRAPENSGLLQAMFFTGGRMLAAFTTGGLHRVLVEISGPVIQTWQITPSNVLNNNTKQLKDKKKRERNTENTSVWKEMDELIWKVFDLQSWIKFFFEVANYGSDSEEIHWKCCDGHYFQRMSVMKWCYFIFWYATSFIVHLRLLLLVISCLSFFLYNFSHKSLEHTVIRCSSWMCFFSYNSPKYIQSGKVCSCSMRYSSVLMSVAFFGGFFPNNSM